MTAPAAPTTDQPTIQPDELAASLPPLEKLLPDYPPLNAPEEKRVAWVRKKIGETNPVAHLLAKTAAKHAHYAAGRMWIAWNTQRREFRELPLEENEIRVSMNHIRPILRARTARLLSSPVDFTIIPDSNAMEQRDKGKVAVNVLKARYRLGRLADKLDMALEYAYCGGVAAFKSFWNPNIGPLKDAALSVPVTEIVTDEAGLPVEDPQKPGQPLMQPTGQMEDRPVAVDAGTGQVRLANEGEPAARYRLGDTDTAIRTVFQIRLNPEATGWTAAEGCRYLVDMDEVPVSEAKKRFPAYADKLAQANDSKPTAAAERAANTAQIRNPGVDPASALGLTGASTGSNPEPKVIIAEYWELPGPYFPRGRMIQIVGDCSPYDGDFPDGIFPYRPVFDEPAAGWAYGRACIADMIDPSDVINRQWTAISQEMWDQGLGQFVSFDVPGVPDQLGREPRLVIKVPPRSMMGNRSIRDIFTRLDHQAVAPDRWRMIEAAERTLFDVGAYHEVTRGQVPPGVDSGVAITQLREQEDGQLRKSVTALKETLIGWARDQLHLARRYYGDTERWIPVQRPDLGFLVEGVRGVDLPDPDQIDIEIENFKPRSEQAFRADVVELMKEQIIAPAQGLKLMDMGRGIEGAFASQSRHYAKARQENLWLERGQATFEQVGEQEAQATVPDPVTGQPVTKGTGVREPVFKVVMPVPEAGGAEAVGAGPPAAPTPGEQVLRNADGVEVMPLILPLDDDHQIHMDVLDEILLDVTKPWALRQLAMAHKSEHRDALQAMMPALPPTTG